MSKALNYVPTELYIDQYNVVLLMPANAVFLSAQQ